MGADKIKCPSGFVYGKNFDQTVFCIGCDLYRP